ncbi:MAG: hypothetical protein Sylvanvirus14_17 [Sylvanvirus sp.]|uniref:Uncharacterized protein n=1 Tax=Sylvanvirus sp. TaxID=2487774 RepID=A0A3G5AI84_9VIRU|nr:MAG: hypothetical protein Sylvanvirus14_17 [Sylvanvirus sp.]
MYRKSSRYQDQDSYSILVKFASYIFSYLLFEEGIRSIPTSKTWIKRLLTSIRQDTYLQLRIFRNPRCIRGALWCLTVSESCSMYRGVYFYQMKNVHTLIFRCLPFFTEWCRYSQQCSLSWPYVKSIKISLCMHQSGIPDDTKWNLFVLPHLEKFEFEFCLRGQRCQSTCNDLLRHLGQIRTLSHISIDTYYYMESEKPTYSIVDALISLSEFSSSVRTLKLRSCGYDNIECILPLLLESKFPYLDNVRYEGMRSLVTFIPSKSDFLEVLQKIHTSKTCCNIHICRDRTERLDIEQEWNLVEFNDNYSFWRLSCCKTMNRFLLPLNLPPLIMSQLRTLTISVNSDDLNPVIDALPSSSLLSGLINLRKFKFIVNFMGNDQDQDHVCLIPVFLACQHLPVSLEYLSLPFPCTDLSQKDLDLVKFFERFTNLTYLTILPLSQFYYSQRFIRALPKLQTLEVSHLHSLQESQRMPFMEDLPSSLLRVHLCGFSIEDFSCLKDQGDIRWEDWWSLYLYRLPHILCINFIDPFRRKNPLPIAASIERKFASRRCETCFSSFGNSEKK